jgi:cytochrome c biogenesis protein ResB
MLIMPERRPALFESDVTIYSKDGQVHDDVISVNNPFTINGYKIYQSSYDEVAGEYSEYSIFEIIKDPWLPIVYAGLIILMIGAVFMFIGGIDSKYAKNE